ncbi:hypothetical protein ACJJID_12965 [Microbulbifer sp. CnH-101-G]|uniref:hypothetical protein n=1 Tax=Microbulbifer sp. CnH-101-G TaxID=3243393 RepID=UPI004039C1D4
MNLYQFLVKPVYCIISLPIMTTVLFSIRLTQNHKGEYIDEHDANKNEDQYYGPYTSLNMSANYTLSDKLVVFAEALNLTNEPLTYYIGDKDRPKQVEYCGVCGQLVFRYSFIAERFTF